MGLNLFEETDNGDDISKIEINKEFAKRFEHNKKREDLQRLEELKKKGLVEDSAESSEESDEEEEDLINSGKKDLQFYEALVRIKKKDPIINQKDVKFFDSDQEEEGAKRKKSKEKPLYLKDVMAKQLIEEGPEFSENPKSQVKSYAEEQEEFRKAFFDAAEEAFTGDDEDLLMEKKKSNEENEEEDNGEIQKKLDEYFGEDENLTENEMFLKNFLLNRMWVDKDKGQEPSEIELEEISAEEEELDEEDKYEAGYNFRYEEGAGDRVLGHARFIDGSVRKKTNARKLQRQRKEERMTQKETEMEQELKYLKNLKMKEIMDKLQKVRTIAGIKDGGACTLNEDDLEEEFDPEEYDRKMKETFDMDYYEAEDADPGFGSGGEDSEGDLEKPDFDKEDELLGLPEGWDEGGPRDGFLAAREKILKRKRESKEAVEEEESFEGEKKNGKKISLQEKVALEKELEEYYKLDYEDTIGDLKTRFKYTSVPSNRYGLSSKEILLMDDKDLNQYVSLKKLAPYRQGEWKVPKQKRYHLKMNNKLLVQGGKSKNPHHKTSKKSTKSVDKEQEETHLEEVNSEAGPSRRSKRRRRQAELKLSHSRLLAYGKLPPKSKIKKTT